MTASACAWAPTPPDELARIVREGGRRGEIYGAPARPRRAICRPHPRPLPRHPAPRVGLQPARAAARERVRRGARPRRHRVHVRRSCWKRPCGSWTARPLAPWPWSGIPDVYQAADDVPFVLESHADRARRPSRRTWWRSFAALACTRTSCELMPDGGGWLIVEFGGATPGGGAGQGPCAGGACSRRGRGPRRSRSTTIPRWRRSSGASASGAWRPPRARPAGGTRWEGWEDSAVAPDRLGPYLRDLRALLDRHGYHADFYGHFGQGCVHMRIDFDLQSAAGLARVSHLHASEAAELVVRVRRLALRRARRRAGARRAAAGDVRDGAGAGLPRVQGASGTREGA